jgi:hypothetical protein
MPFDGGVSPSMKAVVMIDALLAFFDGGDRWIKGRLNETLGDGRCLVGAMELINREQGVRIEPVLDYLHQAISDKPRLSRIRGERTCLFDDLASLLAVNDQCRSYKELVTILRRARELATAMGALSHSPGKSQAAPLT